MRQRLATRSLTVLRQVVTLALVMRQAQMRQAKMQQALVKPAPLYLRAMPKRRPAGPAQVLVEMPPLLMLPVRLRSQSAASYQGRAVPRRVRRRASQTTAWPPYR